MTKRILLLGAGIRHPNLIPLAVWEMLVDSNADGLVDGFTSWSNCTPVYVLDAGQKITLGGVTAAGQIAVVKQEHIHISPNTSYALSVDAALIRSTAENVQLEIDWYTAGDVYISNTLSPLINPGTSYTRQTLLGTSPATAGRADVVLNLCASAIGDTGNCHFRNAIFRRRFDGRG